MLLPWYAIAGAALLITLIFSGSITNDFLLLDDAEYITHNPHIQSLGWENIKSIFTTFYNANYHPLTTLLFAIELKLFGANAVPFHFISLLLHLVNVWLVFVLMMRLNSRKEIAVVVSLFFAIHPLHVESVAWISEQKDVLFSLFYIAGLIAYTSYLRQPRTKYLAITFSHFLLSLLAKPAAVTFPLLLLLLDYYFKRDWNWKQLAEKIPFFLLALVFGIITIYAQQSAGAINADLIPPYTPFQRIFVVSYALVYYIVKLLLPFNLCALHYAPDVLPWYYYICPLLIATIPLLVYKAEAMRRDLIFGLAFYVLSLILVVQIIPVGYAIVSERYSYIPYIGLFFIAGSFYARVRQGEISLPLSIRTNLNYALIGLAMFFSGLSFQRSKVWRDSVSLFSDIVRKYPDEPEGYFSLGKAQGDAGDRSSALASYSHAITMSGARAEVYLYRGNIYYSQKNYEPALKDYLKAVELKPDFAEAMNNAGSVYSLTGKLEEAISYFSKAIAIRPGMELHRARADTYFYMKRYSEALDDYSKTLEYKADLSDVHYNRGSCYFNLQKTPEACAEWRTASSMGYVQAGEMIRAYCQ